MNNCLQLHFVIEINCCFISLLRFQCHFAIDMKSFLHFKIKILDVPYFEKEMGVFIRKQSNRKLMTIRSSKFLRKRVMLFNTALHRNSHKNLQFAQTYITESATGYMEIVSNPRTVAFNIYI